MAKPVRNFDAWFLLFPMSRPSALFLTVGLPYLLLAQEVRVHNPTLFYTSLVKGKKLVNCTWHAFAVFEPGVIVRDTLPTEPPSSLLVWKSYRGLGFFHLQDSIGKLHYVRMSLPNPDFHLVIEFVNRARTIAPHGFGWLSTESASGIWKPGILWTSMSTDQIGRLHLMGEMALQVKMNRDSDFEEYVYDPSGIYWEVKPTSEKQKIVSVSPGWDYELETGVLQTLEWYCYQGECVQLLNGKPHCRYRPSENIPRMRDMLQSPIFILPTSSVWIHDIKYRSIHHLPSQLYSDF